MTKNKSTMPEKPDNENKNKNENLPEATNELLKVLVGEIRESNQIHARDMGKVKDEIQKTNKRIDGIETKFIDNQRLESWQKKVIKKFVGDSVKNVISKKYKKNRSVMAIAYSQAYRNLQTFGYNSMDDTKQKYYEDIINAINSGQVTITEKQVLDRYEAIRS